MIMPIITARPIGEGTEYLPLEPQLLSASVICEQGDGSSGSPYQVCIRIKNTGSSLWRGVIRISLSVDASGPRFFLPGFMYGTNRGRRRCRWPANARASVKTGIFPLLPGGWCGVTGFHIPVPLLTETDA